MTSLAAWAAHYAPTPYACKYCGQSDGFHFPTCPRSQVTTVGAEPSSASTGTSWGTLIFTAVAGGVAGFFLGTWLEDKEIALDGHAHVRPHGKKG